ncbi:MAG TPA: UbiA family prenyltransferase [Vicinamibacteria bacterium]|nr:UbiA family prenyltransferase [Vicinamibacteria bacterium]
MTARTLLELGRVSNLPTVWTNVLAGAVLSRGVLAPGALVILALAASCLYVAGMFLNDAFDRRFDAQARPERPIPSRRATAPQVFGIGFALLASGVGLVCALSWVRGAPSAPGGPGLAPLAAGLVLSALIVFYDAFHKGYPLSVVVMGLCRASLYVLAASTVGTLTEEVWGGALLLLLYVVSLTVVARREGLRPRLRVLVGPLIAGICLLDALFIALAGWPAVAGIAALGFPLTLAGQRYVAGT